MQPSLVLHAWFLMNLVMTSLPSRDNIHPLLWYTICCGTTFKFAANDIFCKQSSVVGIPTTLRAGWFVFWIPVEVGRFTFLRNVQNCSGAQPFSNSVGAGVLSLEWSGQGMKLVTYAHLLPGLRSGVKALFVLMLSWRGVIFVYRFQSPPKIDP